MRATSHEIQAVLFDLGETLLNFGRVDITGLFRQGAKLSYNYLKGLGISVGNFKKYCRKNLTAIRLTYSLSNILGRDFDSLKLLKKINSKKAGRLDYAQWQQLAWLWYEPLSKKATAETDIVETLTALKNMDLKLGILSNTFISAESLDRHLQQFGILDFFPVRLYSYQFSWKKPSAKIFAAAADAIGFPPENIAFVGDRINKDIKPALKTGMTAVLKSAYTNEGEKIPKKVQKINSLSELPKLIEKINSIKKSPHNI
jgi:HAD superfamily hydrolase (TIGR01549 family)